MHENWIGTRKIGERIYIFFQIEASKTFEIEKYFSLGLKAFWNSRQFNLLQVSKIGSST